MSDQASKTLERLYKEREMIGLMAEMEQRMIERLENVPDYGGAEVAAMQCANERVKALRQMEAQTHKEIKKLEDRHP